MPVLKSSSPSTDTRAFVAFSLMDIEREAASLLEGAKRRAAAIVQHAREEAEVARKKGYETGYEEGKRNGHADGHVEGQAIGKREAFAEHTVKLNDLAEVLQTTLRTFNTEREQLAARAGSEVPQLAVAVAARVVKRAGAFDPQVCIANSTAALRLVMRAHDVKLHVHPDDFSLIKATLPELKRRWPALTHIELTEDATLMRGGCRVTTEGGLIDADLQMQLDRIAADLIPEEA